MEIIKMAHGIDEKICRLFGLEPGKVSELDIQLRPTEPVTIIARMILPEEQRDKLIAIIREFVIVERG